MFESALDNQKRAVYMNQQKISKAITILLISLTISATTNVMLVDAKAYSFTATISPLQVATSQSEVYSIIITNTGDSTLGSANIAIPTGFTVVSPVTILYPSTSWICNLLTTSLRLTATEGGAVLSQGENVTCTFEAVAPAVSGSTIWNAEASTSLDGGGVKLALQGEQPTVEVTFQFNPSTISASSTTVNQGQVSLLSQLTTASGGILPYYYQWLEAYGGGTFSPIAGANGPEYVFSTNTLTAIGTWSFKLNITDSSTLPTSVSSNVVDITVNSELVGPEVTANPNLVIQNQASTLTSSSVATGTSPYTFQWFQKAPSQDFVNIGNNSPSYIFPGSTTIGTWEFILEVNDSTGASVNSSTTIVTVSSTPSFTITVIQTAHGTISPGTIDVSLGSNTDFNISPDTGYYIADVFVDGLSVGPVTFFNFVNVDTDHSITATFAPIEYNLAISEIGDGSIVLSPLQATYHYGETVQLTAIPTSGYRFSVWAGDITGSINPISVTIDGSKAVTAIFVMNQYTISVSAGAGGSINPSGTIIVDYEGSQAFTITPNVGYQIVDVLINSTSVGPVSSFAISDVTGDTTISASFELTNVPIVASAGAGGSINPSGTVAVTFGNDQSFIISSDIGYYLADVLVDGVSVGAVSSYTFVSVTSNHTITASFSANAGTHFIDVISSYGSPTASAEVNAGGNFSVSVTSAEGDMSHRWICTGYSIDGGTIVSGTSCTFINVQANHTIVFNWQEQYYVNVISSDGSTTGSGWYDSGATAAVSVSSNTIITDSDTRKVFAGWTGDATGTETISEPMTIDRPKTATANWKTQYQVTYVTSGNTLQVRIPPTEWVDSGFHAIGTFPTSINNSADNTRDILVSDNRPTTITQPLTVTGLYTTQYLVKFIQKGLNADATGTVITLLGNSKTYEQLPDGTWINAGNSITFSYATTIETSDEGKQYILKTANATSPLTINGPVTIEGYYGQQISSGFSIDTFAFVGVPAAVAVSLSISVFAWRKTKKKKIQPLQCKGGFISPSSLQTVNRGDDSTVFIITADSGYKIVDVIVDKTVHLGEVRTHKFVNVKGNHTISAIFRKN